LHLEPRRAFNQRAAEHPALEELPGGRLDQHLVAPLGMDSRGDYRGGHFPFTAAATCCAEQPGGNRKPGRTRPPNGSSRRAWSRWGQTRGTPRIIDEFLQTTQRYRSRRRAQARRQALGSRGADRRESAHCR
jgi:hypothetical protein